jgi:hypothetical protein
VFAPVGEAEPGVVSVGRMEDAFPWAR